MDLPEGLILADFEDAKKKIVGFIRDYFSKTGLSCAVMGLSGGIDSSLVATLACEALGPDRVRGLLMPVDAKNDTKNVEDATQLAETLGMKHQLFEIGPAVDAYNSLDLGKVAKGNLMARLRMAAWYGVANKHQGLVLGTGNKSEIMVGYFTKYGDGGTDILPIADLYKVNVWKLAEYMGISKHLIEKAPSAGLWDNQTDEGELGVTYRELDSILFLRFDKGLEPEAIIARGYSEKSVHRVMRLVAQSQHKREPLPRPII